MLELSNKVCLINESKRKHCKTSFPSSQNHYIQHRFVTKKNNFPNYQCFYFNLNQARDGTARQTRVASEALAHTSGVIALASAAALVRVKVRLEQLGDVLCGHLKLQAGELGGAAVTAQVRAHGHEVLGALDIVTHKGDVDVDLGRSIDGSVHLDLVNHAVRKSLEAVLDVQDKLMEAIRREAVDGVEATGGGIEVNRESGEGLVELGLESKGEGSVEVAEGISAVGLEDQLLHLVLLRRQKVVSLVHNIGAKLAQSLGAIHIAVLGVTFAATGLVIVPTVIVVGVGVLRKEVAALLDGIGVVRRHLGKRQVLNIFASAVAGAIIGAGSSLASLALISGEAFALTGASVADTLVGALGIFVEVA